MFRRRSAAKTPNAAPKLPDTPPLSPLEVRRDAVLCNIAREEREADGRAPFIQGIIEQHRMLLSMFKLRAHAAESRERLDSVALGLDVFKAAAKAQYLEARGFLFEESV